MKRNFTVDHDRFGLNNRGTVKMKEILPKFLTINSSTRNKIVKNKGIIVKNNTMELGYLIDSLHFRRRILLFLTFYKPLSHVSIKVIEKSIKFWKKIDLDFK